MGVFGVLERIAKDCAGVGEGRRVEEEREKAVVVDAH